MQIGTYGAVFTATYGLYFGAMDPKEDECLCVFCDRLTRELGEAFKEMARSPTSAAKESSARMQLGNVITLLNLHKAEHVKRHLTNTAGSHDLSFRHGSRCALLARPSYDTSDKTTDIGKATDIGPFASGSHWVVSPNRAL